MSWASLVGLAILRPRLRQRASRANVSDERVADWGLCSEREPPI